MPSAMISGQYRPVGSLYDLLSFRWTQLKEAFNELHCSLIGLIQEATRSAIG
jgi:hypothetical protein